MGDTVADTLLSRLRDWGVRQVFGCPGDGIDGLLAAWGRAGDEPRFVRARHEEMAAFEAVGYAKLARRFAVCAATGGSGAIHLLNGLYDAKLDRVPVVAIVGQTERGAIGGCHQQEIDLISVFKDVCGAFVQMCTVPEQLPNLIDRAIRTAVDQSTPTCVIFPSDVFDLPYSAPGRTQVPSSLGFHEATAIPSPDGLRAAADVLNSGDRPALLVGQGAHGCVEELTEIADLLGVGAAKAPLGKDVLPDTLPWVTGSIGLLGTPASERLMSRCDTLLTVGSSFPYTRFMPALDQARAVQIDRSAGWIGMRYPYEVNLVGDAKPTLRALISLLDRRASKPNLAWRAEIEGGVARWWEIAERRAMADADPINPIRIFHELSRRMPENAIITADSGSSAHWYARHLRFVSDTRGSLSGNLASMGPGVPYAIGAKWAFPERPVIAFAGDAAMQSNGLAELVTIARYRHEWADPRLAVAVLHDTDPRFGESPSPPGFDYAAFARALGLNGATVESSDEIGAAWESAGAADGPIVLDFHCDFDKTRPRKDATPTGCDPDMKGENR